VHRRGGKCPKIHGNSYVLCVCNESQSTVVLLREMSALTAVCFFVVLLCWESARREYNIVIDAVMDCCCCSKSQLEKPWHQANDTDENNEIARKAYESLMTITLRKPDSPEYLNFSRQVKKRARKQSGTDVYDDDEGVYSIHCYITNCTLLNISSPTAGGSYSFLLLIERSIVIISKCSLISFKRRVPGIQTRI